MKGARMRFRMGKMLGLYVDHWEEWICLSLNRIAHRRQGEDNRGFCAE